MVDPRPAQTTVRELAAGNVKDVLAGPLGVLASPGVSAGIGLLRAAGAMGAAASACAPAARHLVTAPGGLQMMPGGLDTAR